MPQADRRRCNRWQRTEPAEQGLRPSRQPSKACLSVALAATIYQSDDMRNCGSVTALPSAGSTQTIRIYGPLPLRAWSRVKFMA